MKKKLIALTVLSIVGTIGFIMWIAGTANGVKHWVTDYSYFGTTGGHYEYDGWSDIGYALAGCLIFFGCAIAQFVIGIVVLSTKAKHGDNSGITTAAGIIGILGGIIFVGAIVSGIAAAKATSNQTFMQQPFQTSQPQQMTEVEKLKQELDELKRKNAEDQNK